MKKIRWNPRLVTSLFITLLMCTLDCLAQEVIKGFVKDGNDEPLPGVSVAVKGATNVGTITNVDGKYSINVLFFCKKWRFYNGSEEENYQHQSIF